MIGRHQFTIHDLRELQGTRGPAWTSPRRTLGADDPAPPMQHQNRALTPRERREAHERRMLLAGKGSKAQPK